MTRHRIQLRRDIWQEAVGIEFAVNLISPADSVALLPTACPKTHLGGWVLWPRCGQLKHHPLTSSFDTPSDVEMRLARELDGTLLTRRNAPSWGTGVYMVPFTPTIKWVQSAIEQIWHLCTSPIFILGTVDSVTATMKTKCFAMNCSSTCAEQKQLVLRTIRTETSLLEKPPTNAHTGKAWHRLCKEVHPLPSSCSCRSCGSDTSASRNFCGGTDDRRYKWHNEAIDAG